MASGETLLRLPDVLHQSGVGRSTHYNNMRAGLFTKPVSIGRRSCAWPASEVNAINKARIAGRSETDIRALVKTLETKRTTEPA